MNDTFDALIKSHFDHQMELDPLTATHYGLHQYDHRMPDLTLTAVQAEIDFIRGTRDKLIAIDPGTLDSGRRLDLEAARHFLEMTLFDFEQLATWRSFPTAIDMIGMALHPLFSRDFAPLPERAAAITARMEQIPRFLEQSKELLSDPVRLWVNVGVESAHYISGYIKTIVETTLREIKDSALTRRMAEAGERAYKAVDSYRDWLIDEGRPLPRSEYAIGREKFDRLIAMRRLGLDTDQIYRLGEEMFARAVEETERLAHELDGGADAATIRERLKDNHPADFDGVLKGCRDAMDASREFVKSSHFATLPENEKLVVIPTPDFMAHTIPFAAYMPPGRFDREQKGEFLVTPVGEHPKRLREFHHAALVNKAIHEGYPGHHLQLVCANTNPSLARLLGAGVEFIEGWAHYCEEVVAEHGFADSREIEFERYDDMIWRACRIMIDIKLCSGEMPFTDAIDMLVRECHFHQASALAEIKRYTYTPGYQLSYLLGKHLIMELKKKVKTVQGASFSERKFHDAMLYAGNLPMFLMEKVVEDTLQLQTATARA